MKYRVRIIKESNDELINIANSIRKERGSKAIDKETSKKIIDASGYNIDGEDSRLGGLNTISKLLDFFEMSRMIEEKPKEASAVLGAIKKEV